MMLNRADECRQRADECRRNAAQAADDVLRGAYLDLARHWRLMAHQAKALEQKEETNKPGGYRAPCTEAPVRSFYFFTASWTWLGFLR